MGVVVFNQSRWLADYPEFTSVATQYATAPAACFRQACTILDNTDRSKVHDMAVRSDLLDLLTAHIMQIRFGVGGNPPSRLVGRVSQASEGTVSISSEVGSGVGARQSWFLQTTYGALYWNMSAVYRTARYVAPGGASNGYPITGAGRGPCY
jgi:hypothetical protein